MTPNHAQFLNDLKWSLHCPALLAHPAQVPPLSVSEIGHLLQYTAPPQQLSAKLGRRFEALTHAWVSVRGKPVYPGVILRQGKETVGELDLIFMDPRVPDVTQHWEIAIKFYLCQSSLAPQLSDYLGPQGRDRLDLKLDKLTRRQLPLGQSLLAQEWLRAHGLPTRVKSSLFVQGRLFYPWNADWRNTLAPPPISAQHLRGWWAHTQIPVQFAAPEARFQILQKLQWMSGVTSGQQKPIPHYEANLLLKESTLPLGVAEYREQAGQWQEISRGMIVPEMWPL